MYRSFSHTITLRRSRQEIIADAETPHFKKKIKIPRPSSKERSRRQIVSFCKEYEKTFREPIQVQFGGKKSLPESYSVYNVPLVIESYYDQNEIPHRSSRMKLEELQKNSFINAKVEAPQWRKLDQTQA
ncbi:unnamed protein product [Blepharisma stoltei]|uniref:Uncharacterized protein n=1 Tax=Blepharisma stoltei TaxID=1481888 RepID=A0AAU9K7X0_9CILI|nr:unnamed protein product [Blepharisma stoltei]